jgi:hypothetical protein
MHNRFNNRIDFLIKHVVPNAVAAQQNDVATMQQQAARVAVGFMIEVATET